MPIPIAEDPNARKISAELRRCAAAIDKLNRAEGNVWAELGQIARRFGRCADTLEKGVASKRVTKAQLRSIASNLEAIADLLRE